jgi:hypothetical protein
LRRTPSVADVSTAMKNVESWLTSLLPIISRQGEGSPTDRMDRVEQLGGMLATLGDVLSVVGGMLTKILQDSNHPADIDITYDIDVEVIAKFLVPCLALQALRNESQQITPQQLNFSAGFLSLGDAMHFLGGRIKTQALGPIESAFCAEAADVEGPLKLPEFRGFEILRCCYPWPFCTIRGCHAQPLAVPRALPFMHVPHRDKIELAEAMNH